MKEAQCYFNGKSTIHLAKIPFEIFKKRRLFILGECECGSGDIRLDWRWDMIPTLVHELLHFIKPDWNETEVESNTKKIIKKLSNRQVKWLLKKMVSKL